MNVSAAVFRGANAPQAIEQLELATPGPEQVRVSLRASGVCHSDLHVANGDWPMDAPLVLGHEGAGVVEAVGPGVRDVAVGDHVVLSWFAPCRRCRACAGGRAWACTETRALDNTLPDGSIPLRTADGTPVAPYLGVGTFAEATVVPESAAVAIPPDVPFGIAALIGCAVTTGVGAVLNTAQVRAGEAAVVIGCGGVGQSIVLGLALVGANPIVAVDLSDDRLALARELGATHTVRGDDPRLDATIRSLTAGGAEYAFEAIGRPATIELLPRLLCAGGAGVLVGLTASGATAAIDPFDVADNGKRLLGCNYGSSVPAVDFPRLAELYRAGRLPLDRLIGGTVELSQVDRALDDLKAATGLRTIIDLTN